MRYRILGALVLNSKQCTYRTILSFHGSYDSRTYVTQGHLQIQQGKKKIQFFCISNTFSSKYVNCQISFLYILFFTKSFD